MKRITRLEIANFRAFYETYIVALPKGENLLIYGENGSGKSSLFKSLNNFFSSSQNIGFPFVKHYSKIADDGNVTFTFHDYNNLNNEISSEFGEIISFGSTIVTTGSEQFVKTAELTKGFLDYKGLLAVYNHTEAQPNLFNLIIHNLFKDFIPIHLGGTHPLGNRFSQLYKKITQAYNRRTHDYKNGIPEMVAYELLLRKVLDEVFLQLNVFLIKYFKLNLRVWYILKPLVSTGSWRDIPRELRLEIKLNNVLVPHQSDFLNEARLSALAICLYLAVIKKNAQQIDLKVLFLDDVFIGLDLNNRLPILEILKREFSDYQVFISTYDRHLYELAKLKFETEMPGKWKTIELYVGRDEIDGKPVDRPILVIGETHYEKATQYLHNRSKPDYPAAANYFRKALEQIISENVPPYEKVDIDNKVQILDYKLGPLIYRTKRFLERINQRTDVVDEIITLLPSLLHPLSHHEITSPIYRGELVKIEKLIPSFSSILQKLKIGANIRCSPLEGRTELKIKFTINNLTGHFSYYYLRTTEPLLLINNGHGLIGISATKCFIEKCYGENNGVEIAGSRKSFTNDEKALDVNNFSSILNAYNTVYNRMITIPAIGNFPKDVNYLDAIEFLDQLGNYQPINHVIIW